MLYCMCQKMKPRKKKENYKDIDVSLKSFSCLTKKGYLRSKSDTDSLYSADRARYESDSPSELSHR